VHPTARTDRCYFRSRSFSQKPGGCIFEMPRQPAFNRRTKAGGEKVGARRSRLPPCWKAAAAKNIVGGGLTPLGIVCSGPQKRRRTAPRRGKILSRAADGVATWDSNLFLRPAHPWAGKMFALIGRRSLSRQALAVNLANATIYCAQKLLGYCHLKGGDPRLSRSRYAPDSESGKQPGATKIRFHIGSATNGTCVFLRIKRISTPHFHPRLHNRARTNMAKHSSPGVDN